MKAVIIGIGLIGGSLARDIRRSDPEATVLGMDISDAHLEAARELGLIGGKASDADLAAADLVVVSIPVDRIVEELPSILDRVGDETLVIDAGSTKAPICREVAAQPSAAASPREDVPREWRWRAATRRRAAASLLVVDSVGEAPSRREARR